jgi:sensor c-di-GMP phosphodiesterase-like protein
VLAIITEDLPRILEINPDFEVAINMSAGDLRSGLTLERLSQLLDTAGAQPHNIGIEATERAFLHDPETAELIGTLRRKGFRVAIDDFGTGYSSLACLQSLSLDTLKIDKAFVETIDTNGATSQVVLHIIEMAHSLHLQMVAEGVESEAQAQFLLRRGVRYAQGWLFSRPVAIDSLLQKVQLHLTAPEERLLTRSLSDVSPARVPASFPPRISLKPGVPV